jgi:SOS-response transcriptional repressor LexA
MKHDVDAIVTFIQTYTAARGFAPSVLDIKKQFGFSSTSMVKFYLDKLQQQGRVQWEPGMARTLRVVSQ